MRCSFVVGLLNRLLDQGVIDRAQSTVAVCAGESDKRVLADVGFRDVTLTNVDVASGTMLHGSAVTPGSWIEADSHELPFDDGAFDLAFVSDGLHHCRSPHRAVTEMFRVARVGIVVIESRDSLAMRLAEWLTYTDAYEFNGRLLETREQGGVDFGPVPNFVYRWTEREFEKLLSSYDPAHDNQFMYFYGLHLPERLRGVRLAKLAASLVTAVSPQQGNTFGMVALKGPVKGYLTGAEDGLRLRDDVRGPQVQRSSASPSRKRHRIR